MNENIGCLIGTYDRYADKLDALLTSLSDYYTVIGYDAIEKLPPIEAIQKGGTFFISGQPKGKQEGSRYYHTNGLWILKENFKYALSITGDAIIDRPENIPKLIDVLATNDIICSQWNGICATMMYFGLTQLLYKVFCDIPKGPPQLEKKFSSSLKRNNAKYKIYECCSSNQGIWGDIIGYKRWSGNYMSCGKKAIQLPNIEIKEPETKEPEPELIKPVLPHGVKLLGRTVYHKIPEKKC